MANGELHQYRYPIGQRLTGENDRLMGQKRNGRETKQLPELLVRDANGWRRWLMAHHADSNDVRLVLSKGGATKPTKLTYDQALEEVICHGWIDGQGNRRDDATYLVRFTPRRKRSVWSKRNTEIAERLLRQGRMRPGGLAEIARAKSDGRWAAAYAGMASSVVPPDLARALDAKPAAKVMFAGLSAQNRYAILYRIAQAKRPQTRASRIEKFATMLARGETISPQRPVGTKSGR